MRGFFLPALCITQAAQTTAVKAADEDLHLSFFGLGNKSEESIIFLALQQEGTISSDVMKKAELLLFMLAGQEKKELLSHCHPRKLALIETNHASKSVCQTHPYFSTLDIRFHPLSLLSLEEREMFLIFPYNSLENTLNSDMIGIKGEKMLLVF